MRTQLPMIFAATALLAAPTGSTAQGISGGGVDGGSTTANVKSIFVVTHAGTKVQALTARAIAEGGQVTVTCSGRGCSFTKRTLEPADGQVAMRKLFKKRLQPGARIEVRMLGADGAVTKTVTYRIRKNLLPKTQAS